MFMAAHNSRMAITVASVMPPLRRRVLLAAGALPVAGLRAAPRHLHHQALVDDAAAQEMLALLDAALRRSAASHGEALLQPSSLVLDPRKPTSPLQQLATRLESAPEGLQLIWAPTSDHLERRLLPVEWDLRRGLDGLRVAIVLHRREAEFASLRDARDLRGLRIGLVAEAPELEALQQAGALQAQAWLAKPERLLQHLRAGRVDLVLRGVADAWNDGPSRERVGAVVEPRLLFQSPRPMRFFVSRREPGLRRRIELGLQALQDDGSLHAHLWRWHAAVVHSLQLGSRRLIALPHPCCSTATQAADLAYWLRGPGQ
jgi:hypothetical protein